MTRDHSYEEIRSVILDILLGRERVQFEPSQYKNLELGVAEVFERREGSQRDRGVIVYRPAHPSANDSEIVREVFWDLFRQGVITPGINSSNENFPFFRLSRFGRTTIAQETPYRFHDTTSYIAMVKGQVPDLDGVTQMYLEEAVEAYHAGCLLAATVMVGVATEHTFLRMLESVEQSPTHGKAFANVSRERTVLQKIIKFQNLLEPMLKQLKSEIREDLETNFLAIQSLIRTFRNQAGHPTGTTPPREQVYVLLQLFAPYARKLHQLRGDLSE